MSLDVLLSTGTDFARPALRWATKQGGFWSAQKWFSGDFNGDGFDDLATVFDCGNGTACIVVHVSNGSSFVRLEQWSTNQGGYWTAQKWLSGDFNGDGRTDLAKAFKDGGNTSIDVHLSVGNAFSMQRWATKQGGYSDAQKWMSGDFNADGVDDVAKAFGESGKSSIDVHISNRAGFSMQRWTTKQGGFWGAQKWMVGDFDGDGRDDAIVVFDNGGSALSTVHRSNGSGFLPEQQWSIAQSFANEYIDWLAGDFTGDGLADLTFESSQWATLRMNVGSRFDAPPAPPVTCSVISVPLFAGYVQCTFSRGGISGFNVSETANQFAPPRSLYNPVIGAYDRCTPVGPVPYSRSVDREVCR